MEYEAWRSELSALEARRKALFEATQRRWYLPCRTSRHQLVAELCWSTPSLRPRIVVTDPQDARLVPSVNDLSLAGMKKYMALHEAVQEWRRGKAMLPAGDQEVIGENGQQATHTEEDTP